MADGTLASGLCIATIISPETIIYSATTIINVTVRLTSGKLDVRK